MFEVAGDVSRVRPSLVSDHRKWSRLHDASWHRLDEAERWAWRAFGTVEGQLAFRETLYRGKDKKGEQFAILEGAFVERVLSDWLEVPRELRADAWSGVQLLHDFQWQEGREHASICWHPQAPLGACDPTRIGGGLIHCLHCRHRWRCARCWTQGQWHSSRC